MSTPLLPPYIPGSGNYNNLYVYSSEVYTLTDGQAVLSQGYLSNLNDPVQDRDAANKQFVLDNVTGDPGTNRTWKTAVRLATTTNITNLSGLIVIDGVLTELEDRVLVMNQTDQTQNGIWTVDTNAWFRSVDCPVGIQATGVMVVVTSGDSNNNKLYLCNNTDITGEPVNFGDVITFIIYGESTAGGSNTQIQYNNNGVLAGNSNMTFDGTSLNLVELNTNIIDSYNDISDVYMYNGHLSNILFGSSTTSTLSVNVSGYGGSIAFGAVNGGPVYNNGNVSIQGANSGVASYTPSSIGITAGNSMNFCDQTGAAITLTTGHGNGMTPGGDVNINANYGGPSGGKGGSVYLNAGSGGTGANGGNIVLTTGLGGTGATSGNIVLSTSNTGQTIIQSSTNSVGISTGALVVLGGASVSGNLYANNIYGTFQGSLVLTTGNLLIGNGSNIAKPQVMSGDASITTSGVLSLATVVSSGAYTNANITIDEKGRVISAANGSSGNPGGSNGQLQYNNGGAFAGISTWLYTQGALVGSGSSFLYAGGTNNIGNSTSASLYNTGTIYSASITANNISAVTGITTAQINNTGISYLQDIYATEYYTYSDERLKNNITEIETEYAMDVVSKMKGYNYSMNDDRRHYGFIAQQLRETGIQNNVINEENEYLSVNYVEIIPLLVQCIKGLNNEIKDLKMRIIHE